MGEDASQPGSNRERRRRPPTRKLSLASRIREAVRDQADRLLGVDPAWSALFVLVLLGLFSAQRCGTDYRPLEVGQVAPHDMRAHGDIEAVDVALTEQRRRETRDAMPDVYVHDRGRASRLDQELAGLFLAARAALVGVETPPEPAVTAQLFRSLQDRIPAEALDALVRDGFSEGTEQLARAALNTVMKRLIIGNKTIVEQSPAILVVHVPGSREERIEDFATIFDLAEARELAAIEIGAATALTQSERRAIAALVSRYVDANLAFDPARTEARRDEAAALVPSAMVKIRRGDLLVRQAQRVDADALARLEAARQGQPGGRGWLQLLGLSLLLLLMAFFLYRYATYHQRHFKGFENLHALLILVMLLTLTLSQALRWVAREVVDGLPDPFGQPDVYTYFVPIAAGSILIALLANSRIAMVYSTFTAVLFGGLVGWDLRTATWALLVQWAGVYAISTYRERAALLRAGIVVGGAAAVVALALEVVEGTLEPGGSLFGAGLAFAGGALWVGLLVSYALPLFEGMFHVLTDIRLLELSDVNKPLLSQLAVKAPGTYNHSVVVATLAEEAAKEIGADSLLCRVAAFYHDIGKIEKPDYYVENMRGSNPHDKLSPSMSALIISAHVKDGVKLAREAGLPQRIIDIIPQHHGTRLMSYFYERARETADPALGPIKEEDFRYKGPKPQTKESAIFMLADGLEAASRTLEDPTPPRLRDLIRKMTNVIVLDGQFDGCDLTFADLKRIQEAFLRTLVSFHHRRIDYPGFDGKRRPTGSEGKDTGERGTAAPTQRTSSGR